MFSRMEARACPSTNYSVVHRIPESFRAFCRIVSFTAANTKRIFVVSVACVRLLKRQILGQALESLSEDIPYWGYRFRCALLT
jgi:hypothetical protein